MLRIAQELNGYFGFRAMGAEGAVGNSGAANFYGGNQHNDVLHAKPVDAEATTKLVEELKRRGNAAVKFKSFMEADVLYSKAIEHDPGNKALYGNRCMARLSMGQYETALHDADKALEIQNDWTKIWFRKGLALVGLERLDDAQKAYEKVIELDPKNKAASKELGLMDKRRADKKISDEKKAKEQAEFEARKIRPITKKVVEEKKPQDKKPKQGKKAEKDGEVDMSLRGYKTLADGRKTTYFNRELTEEEKALLKDNKPKQVVASDELKQKEAELTQGGVSAWNAGGTFEEKDMSDWAQDRLRALLVGVKASVKIKDADGDVISEDIEVTGLRDLEGGASIADRKSVV